MLKLSDLLTTEDAIKHFLAPEQWDRMSTDEKFFYKDLKGKFRNGGHLTINRMEKELRKNGYKEKINGHWLVPEALDE